MQAIDFTVVGFYKDNSQPWHSVIQARVPDEAVEFAIKEHLELNGWDEDYADNLIVVAVLSGTALPAREIPEIFPGDIALSETAGTTSAFA